MTRTKLRSLGVAIMLVIGLLVPLTAAGHYHDVEEAESCIIPANDPIEMTVEEGWQAVVVCEEDGTVRVHYEAEQPIGDDEDDPTSDIQREFGGDAARSSNRAQSDVEVASTRRSEKGCVARSIHHDVVTLKLTWGRARIDYQYSSEKNHKRSVRTLYLGADYRELHHRLWRLARR